MLYSILMIKERLYKILPIVALFALATFFAFYYPPTVGIDNYYHIRHAWIYQTQGMFNSDFPWLENSIIGKLGGDIWYGFHILLIPFTFFTDLLLGIKFATVAVTSFTLLAIYFVFKKFNVRWPLLWTIFFFFSVPDVHFRLMMLRPHVLTLALLLIIFYLLIEKRSGKHIFIASTLASFIHISLLWLPLLIAFIIFICQRIFEKRWEIKNNIYLLLGLIIGAILRPNALSSLKIAYVQVVQLSLEKLNNAPLRFGTELRPGNSLSIFLFEILPISLIVIAGIISLIIFLKNKKVNLQNQEKTLIWSLVTLYIIFGILFYSFARRTADIWVLFSVLLAAVTFSIVFKNNELYLKFKKIFLTIFFIAIIAFGAQTLKIVSGYISGLPPQDMFKEPATWLKENSQKEDIVFNTRWDNFSFMFFWNQHNHFINGMDPIFEYTNNKSLYLQHYFLEIDKILMVNGEAYTCGANPCQENSVSTVYDSLKKNFNAKYIFVEPARNPKLYKFLDSDKRFDKVFDAKNGLEVVFKVL
ncbi:MAG: hypothetical protein Q8Q90_01955 [bacterium]|nr:hypothetical protein [bacterium]